MESLETLLSFPGIEKRISNSGLSKFEYQQELNEYINNSCYREGSAENILNCYDLYLKRKKSEDRLLGNINKVIWAANAISPLTLVNFFSLVYIDKKCKIVEALHLPQEYCFGGVALLSIAEFLGIRYAFKKPKNNENKASNKKILEETAKTGYTEKEMKMSSAI